MSQLIKINSGTIQRRVFLLLLLLPLCGYSQPGTIYFSVTGDTVCYASVFGYSADSSGISHTVFIKRKNNSGEPITISSFSIRCKASNSCLESLSRDTVRKYGLALDGTDQVWGPGTDLVYSVKPTNTQVLRSSTTGAKYIYQTRVQVFLSCKGQKLYEDEFDLMFKGNTPEDFLKGDIVRIKAWRKKNTKKYFVDLNVKYFQVYSGSADAEESRFKNFMFVQ